MRVRVHRGTKEVGGNCIELSSCGKTLLLDMGMPLTAPAPANVKLPQIEGLQRDDLDFRDNQHVRRRLRIDVAKGQAAIILVNNVGGDFLVENSLEDCFRRCHRSLAPLFCVPEIACERNKSAARKQTGRGWSRVVGRVSRCWSTWEGCRFVCRHSPQRGEAPLATGVTTFCINERKSMI